MKKALLFMIFLQLLAGANLIGYNLGQKKVYKAVLVNCLDAQILPATCLAYMGEIHGR